MRFLKKDPPPFKRKRTPQQTRTASHEANIYVFVELWKTKKKTMLITVFFLFLNFLNKLPSLGISNYHFNLIFLLLLRETGARSRSAVTVAPSTARARRTTGPAGDREGARSRLRSQTRWGPTGEDPRLLHLRRPTLRRAPQARRRRRIQHLPHLRPRRTRHRPPRPPARLIRLQALPLLHRTQRRPPPPPPQAHPTRRHHRLQVPPTQHQALQAHPIQHLHHLHRPTRHLPPLLILPLEADSAPTGGGTPLERGGGSSPGGRGRGRTTATATNRSSL